MIHSALLLMTAAILVIAAVGCVVGARRLTYWIRLDHTPLGELIVTFAWVLPEYLIALNGLLAPGIAVNHYGDPFLIVGATLGAAAGNMLVIGIVGAVWPEEAGLEMAGRSLASAAIVLLMSCVALAGSRIGRGDGATLARWIVRSFNFALFLVCLRLVYRRGPGEKLPAPDPDLAPSPGRGTPIGAFARIGASVIALVYTSPHFVRLAAPWFRSGGDLPRATSALLLSGLTIALGLLLSLPDLILSIRMLGGKEGDAPAPRLLLGCSALIAFTAVVGINPGTLWHTFASSLFASCFLSTFVTAVAIILLLAVPSGPSARSRGLIVGGVASAGLLFSLLITGH